MGLGGVTGFGGVGDFVGRGAVFPSWTDAYCGGDPRGCGDSGGCCIELVSWRTGSVVVGCIWIDSSWGSLSVPVYSFPVVGVGRACAGVTDGSGYYGGGGHC